MKYDRMGETSNVPVRATVVNFLDIGLAFLYLLVAGIAVVSLPAGSALRAAVALPFVLFLPGYAVVTALYPRNAGVTTPEEQHSGRRGLLSGTVGWPERAALSVALSVATLPIAAVVLSAADVSVAGGGPQIVAVEALTFVGLMVGLVRRSQLPRSERVEVPYGTLLDEVSGLFSSSRPLTDRLLTVVLAVLVVSSFAGLAYAVAAPPSAEQYTTFALVTEDDDGEFVAGEYPQELTRGQAASLTVAIENHEGSATEYTVVPVLQRVDRSGGSLSVVERQRLAPFEVSLDAGETTYERHSLTPELAGENLRVVYLLYVGDPPADPTVDSAYRYVHFSTNVSSP